MKTIASALVVASLVVASVNACSSSSSTTASDTPDASPTPTKDGGVDSGAPSTSDAGTDAGSACNTLVNSAPESTYGEAKSAAPAGTGGAIADGTYFLTHVTLYDPNGTDMAQSPAGLKVTLKITGTVMESIQTLPDDSTDTFTESFVVAGTALNRTLSCPKTGADLAATFTVSGNDLTIYETDPQTANVAGSVYVKQ